MRHVVESGTNITDSLDQPTVEDCAAIIRPTPSVVTTVGTFPSAGSCNFTKPKFLCIKGLFPETWITEQPPIANNMMKIPHRVSMCRLKKVKLQYNLILDTCLFLLQTMIKQKILSVKFIISTSLYSVIQCRNNPLLHQSKLLFNGKIKKYSIHALWRIDHSCRWRMISTLRGGGLDYPLVCFLNELSRG